MLGFWVEQMCSNMAGERCQKEGRGDELATNIVADLDQAGIPERAHRLCCPLQSSPRG